MILTMAKHATVRIKVDAVGLDVLRGLAFNIMTMRTLLGWTPKQITTGPAPRAPR